MNEANKTTTPLDVAIVVIGRNEGARLQACLAALTGLRVVYVDSGSKDDSVANAKSAGAKVVSLSPDRPFTAARARREGAAALGPDGPEFIQFLDGDCVIQAGWLEAGLAWLKTHPNYGLVTGWRREIAPDASLYNDLCHQEWNRPAGDILTCGGDMLVRAEALRAAGSFDDQVIAAEDDEFCVRLRKAGWKLHRLPYEMTQHDAAMLRFGQWWQRAVRSGHGFAQVGYMHPPYFSREINRVRLYGMILPIWLLIGFAVWLPLIFLAIGGYGFNFLRTAQGLRGEGLGTARALRHASLITLSKLPNAIGMLTFHRRRLWGAKMQIIEYK